MGEREYDKWLGDAEYDILSILDERGGFMTSKVSELMKTNYCRDHKRMRSHAVRSWLMKLKKFGYVGLLDNLSPTVWVRTPSGTEKLLSVQNNIDTHAREGTGDE